MEENRIISVSLKDDVLQEITRLQRIGYAGRSDVIRAGIRLLASELLNAETTAKRCSAVLVLKYEERSGEVVQHIQHEAGSLVQTKLHNHLDHNVCMDVLVLKGSGTKIHQLARTYQTTKGVFLAKLAVL